jgi:hypothetical protein
MGRDGDGGMYEFVIPATYNFYYLMFLFAYFSTFINKKETVVDYTVYVIGTHWTPTKHPTRHPLNMPINQPYVAYLPLVATH